MAAGWALIKDGVVINVALFEDEWDRESVLEWGAGQYDDAVNTNGEPCAPGWIYSDGAFTDPSYEAPSNQEMYQNDLNSLATTYNSDIMKLSDQYAKAALIDGVNENTKKAAIYAEYQARKVTYQTDLAALKVKYGV